MVRGTAARMRLIRGAASPRRGSGGPRLIGSDSQRRWKSDGKASVAWGHLRMEQVQPRQRPRRLLVLVAARGAGMPTA